MTEDLKDAAEAYGKLKEGAHLAGYSFSRACASLEWLLIEERWRLLGHDKVEAFLETVKLGEFRHTAEARKRIGLLIKKQTEASNRQIAAVLGVGHVTVNRDLGTNVPAGGRASKGAKAVAGTNVPPGLSGEDAARVVARADRVAARHGEVDQRVERAAMDAKALGKFSLILADPPWDDEFGRSDRAIENHYPTMKREEILAMPVEEIAHEQAMLFLWATPSMAELGFETARAWGFDYRTQMIWVKPTIGLGKYVRQRHEILLICRRGNHPAPAPETLVDSVTEAPRGRHSEKPAIFHKHIERMYPDAAKIELFRRGRPRKGWAIWGAEAKLEAAE